MIKRKFLILLGIPLLLLNTCTLKVKGSEIPDSVGIWEVIEQEEKITTINVNFEKIIGEEAPSAETHIIQHTRAEDIERDSAEFMKHNRWDIELTEDERNLLANIVYLEAGNQGLSGQEYVVTVILNRMKNEAFPSNLYDVLSQENPTQFVTWKIRHKSAPTEETYQAIDEVLAGTADENITNVNYLYFSRGKGSDKAVKIGDHWFW